MKWMIASDIHGSAYWCERLLEMYEREGAERLLLLGDLLYHGPRNALPKDYDPQSVAAMLNRYADRIMAVRGNCDAEIDQMILNFPMMADYALLSENGSFFFATHGHIHSRDALPPLAKGAVLLNGHFHVPAAEKLGEFCYINPGSVSIPKEGSPNSCIVFEDGLFLWKAIGGGEFMRFEL